MIKDSSSSPFSPSPIDDDDDIHHHHFWVIGSYVDDLTKEVHYLFIFPDEEELKNKRIKDINSKNISLLSIEQEGIFKNNSHLISENDLNNIDYAKRYCFEFWNSSHGESIEIFPAYLQSNKDVKYILNIIQEIKEYTFFLEIKNNNDDGSSYSYIGEMYDGKLVNFSENETLKNIKKIYFDGNFDNKRKLKMTILPYNNNIYIREAAASPQLNLPK